MRRVLVAVVLIIIAAPCIVSAQGRGQARPREIVQIRGDLYYVSGSANTVFLVTPDGVIHG